MRDEIGAEVPGAKLVRKAWLVARAASKSGGFGLHKNPRVAGRRGPTLAVLGFYHRKSRKVHTRGFINISKIFEFFMVLGRRL